MLTKARVLKTIEALPEYFSLDDLIERFMFLNDLEIRLQESKTGQLTDHDEFKNEMLENEWDNEEPKN